MPDQIRQVRKKATEQRLLQDAVLKEIRTATKANRTALLVEARRAGYSYHILGMAAGISYQAVQHMLVKHEKVATIELLKTGPKCMTAPGEQGYREQELIVRSNS